MLEQLETQFYKAAIDKFKAADITAAGFQNADLLVEQLSVIQGDEATHAAVLEDALASFGKDAISSQCKFNFDAVLSDLPTTLATARVVENIGVSAYIGAAHLLSDPVLLSSAASIATVEARHQTILNILSGAATVIPQSFDLALTPSEILAMAGPFISGCDLGVPANIPLSVTNTDAVKAGTKLEFKASSLNSSVDTSKFHCQMMVGGAPESISLPFDGCVVPDTVNGPVAIWITSDDQPLANNVRDRDTIKQVAGPLMTFIDAKTQLLPSLVRQTGATGTSSATTVTSTVSPDDAKKIIDGANGSNSTDTSSSNGSNSDSSSSDSSKSGDNSGDNQGDDGNNSGSQNDASANTINKFTGTTKAGGVTVDGWGETPAN